MADDPTQRKLDQILSILNDETLTVEGASKMDAGEVVRTLLEQDSSLDRDDLIDRMPLGHYWEYLDSDTKFRIRTSVANIRSYYLRQMEG